MDYINESKISFSKGDSFDEPFIVQYPDEMLDLKLFFKDYAKECIRIAIDEYRIESAFNKFQPQFLLCEYNRNTWKYGVNPEFRSKEDNNLKEELEDAISFAADLCAVYVKNNPTAFNPGIIDEANTILQRQDQYEYDRFYLGFGYFIKQVFINHNILSITDWFEKYVTQYRIVYSLIVREIKYASIFLDTYKYKYTKEPKEINIVCTYMLEKFIYPKLIRIKGQLKRSEFYHSENNHEYNLFFLNQQVPVNTSEFISRL